MAEPALGGAPSWPEIMAYVRQEVVDAMESRAAAQLELDRRLDSQFDSVIREIRQIGDGLTAHEERHQSVDSAARSLTWTRFGILSMLLVSVASLVASIALNLSH